MAEKTFKFETGRILITPGAEAALGRDPVKATELLIRHLSGDWGEVDKHDQRVNDQGVKYGTRLLSAYSLPDTQPVVKIWIITEADRSVTTILLPDEY